MKWGEKNLRKYPWRETSNVYKVAIAEILLHRTKADQVLEIYNKFTRNYPNFEAIKKAGLKTIKRELYSLGLEWRAELLYEMSDIIIKEFNGKLPLDKKLLLKLPGIGEYIASAILCFGFNLPEPILDTNTVRIIGRIFGLKITDSSRRKKEFKDIMSSLVDNPKPRFFSFAMLDFAAFVCVPKNPICKECILNKLCKYYS